LVTRKGTPLFQPIAIHNIWLYLIGRRVVLTRPQVPVELEEIRIHDLDVGGARLDLSVYREGNDVAVRVLRRENDVQVIVMP
jgi:hypothetical protein